MANNNIVPTAIVRELLDKDNYDHWSIQVETYLVAQDLWDVVEAPIPSETKTEADKAWYKRNAAALHAIQISCSSDTFNLIGKIRVAKEAWDTLATNFSDYSKEGQLQGENVGENAEEGQLQGENVGENAVSDEYMCFFNDVGEGKWEAVEQFLTLHEEAVRFKSPTYGRTALHVAVSIGYLRIVEELVKLMTAEELEIQDCDGYTAFLIAVEKGNIPMLKCMVEKNANLLSVRAIEINAIPVQRAIICGWKEMARYLYSLTVQQPVLLEDNGRLGADLMMDCIRSHMFDIAMDLIKRHPHLMIAKKLGPDSPIYELACQHAIYPSGFQLRFWQWWIYNCMHVPSQHATNHVCLNIQNDGVDNTSNKRSTKFMLGIEHIYKLKVVHTQAADLLRVMCKEIKTFHEDQIREAQLAETIETAAALGNVEFIIEISKAMPKTVWTNTVDLFKVFEWAIYYRQPKVFSLIHGIDYKQAIASKTNSDGETLLQAAGRIAGSDKLNQVAGAALQMQRELQWYKEVESITSEVNRGILNGSGESPFTEHHKDLMIAGEKWMKDISSSCSFVGALIFTIMFTAAFTLPGGNNQNTGFPMFLDKNLFKIFIISDAISLFSSTTSVLTFLGILTSRYAEDDFLISLPRKMILGLSTLFLSIATMMVSFCAAIALLFHKQLWVVTPIILIACIPVTLFVFLQFPLLVNIFRYTYGRSIFDRKVENWLG